MAKHPRKDYGCMVVFLIAELWLLSGSLFASNAVLNTSFGIFGKVFGIGCILVLFLLATSLVCEKLNNML